MHAHACILFKALLITLGLLSLVSRFRLIWAFTIFAFRGRLFYVNYIAVYSVTPLAAPLALTL